MLSNTDFPPGNIITVIKLYNLSPPGQSKRFNNKERGRT